MKIISLHIQEGLFGKDFYFSECFNLIYSDENSAGKTTLLRCLLYALGYSIPNTKKFKMQDYTFEIQLVTDSGKHISITRYNAFCHLNIDNGETRKYTLPDNIQELHTLIFENANENILENILGTMYLDQEKGWTLLNRGKVIGAINFNLQKLIQGVANIDCSDLYMELNYVEQQLKKYKNMLSFANYKQKMNDITQIYDYNSDADKIESEILTLEAERTPLEIEYKRLNSVLQKNISFKKYITSMKLYVQDENGKQIPVNENTICGFKDNINYISTKIKIINNEILKLNKKIEKNEKSQNKANALFQTDTESMIKTFESDISRIHIDYASVHNMIKLLEGKQQQLKDCIDEETKSNHCIIAALHELISQYTKELGLDEKYVSPSRDYIFTSDLKSLSGAIFHKIVFSFKLAYVAIIEKYSNINLPIILDSPRGKEVDEINIKKMIDILKRDFSHHQIIIASIYKYNIEPLNVIQLKKYLLEFN